ncbi:urease accessory protein UreD, partial [Yoonia sp.]|uniref:urease accessory protein UreD n=1 Tax=Yoonia sp. TaxID=2212373 RepID=UPI0035C81162
GCLRLLFPQAGGNALDAVLINTSGGVTGGDRIDMAGSVGAGSAMTLTTQAAERAYRAQPDQTGRITTRISVGEDATLCWLPQEIILFDGCNLSRKLKVDLAVGARALIVEPVVFGRTAMGETLTDAAFRDRIAISRGGAPIYSDGVQMTGHIVDQLARNAVGQGMSAMVSVVYAHPLAQARLSAVRAHLPITGGATLLAENLLAIRIMAQDSYLLRRSLMPIIELLSGTTVPKTWRL